MGKTTDLSAKLDAIVERVQSSVRLAPEVVEKLEAAATVVAAAGEQSPMATKEEQVMLDLLKGEYKDYFSKVQQQGSFWDDPSILDDVENAIEEMILNADTAVEKVMDAQEEYEQSDDNLGNYFMDGYGAAFDHQWKDMDTFARKEINDNYLGDLAEVVQKALDLGLDSDAIFGAIEDVGELVFRHGWSRNKNDIVTSGPIGEIEISIPQDLMIENPVGDEIPLGDLVKLLQGPLGELTSRKLSDIDPKRTAGDFLAYRSIDGVVALNVKPQDLADALELDRLENERSDSEPSEDDITTEDHSKFYQHGKLVLTVDRDASTEEMWAALDKYMEKSNFFPNVFFISDHGNVTLMKRD